MDDIFPNAIKIEEYHSEMYDTNNTHGSECTLSSAIASYIVQGKDFSDAMALAQE